MLFKHTQGWPHIVGVLAVRQPAPGAFVEFKSEHCSGGRGALGQHIGPASDQDHAITRESG